jgi:putative ABC transport system ATP-binding protein
VTAIVETRNLVKDYGKGAVAVHALRGVDLSIEAGEFTAMAGPSGSGKSTLLNMIGALDKPTGGEVLIEGKSTRGLGAQQLSDLRRDRIGFIFQSFNLIPVMTALENAEYVLMLQGAETHDRRKRVKDLFQKMGIAGLENRFPHQLSGGQQQRVAVARAVAASPALVLADEPTANVDTATGAGLIDLMADLNRDAGVTFLISTHDPTVMERARRLLSLKDGRILSDVAQ